MLNDKNTIPTTQESTDTNLNETLANGSEVDELRRGVSAIAALGELQQAVLAKTFEGLPLDVAALDSAPAAESKVLTGAIQTLMYRK